MNRFAFRKNLFKKIRLGWLPYAIFAVFMFLFLKGINSVSDTTLNKQQESLEQAIYRDIIQCYAVEGTYPPSLSYMEENYGLIYDKAIFFVDYQAIGSNIMPDVTIIRKSAE